MVKKPIDIIHFNHTPLWEYWNKEDELIWDALAKQPCCVASAEAKSKRGLNSTNNFLFCWTGIRFVMVEVEDGFGGGEIFRISIWEPKGLEFKNIKVYDEVRWLELAKIMMLDVL